MRIDKFLSLHDICTRKESKPFLKKGNVHVNGELITRATHKIVEGDEVVIGDFTIIYEEFSYFVMNKPQNVVSATKDNVHPTVLDLLGAEDYQTDLFPVGRLDIDTTGLLIITNDGQLAHQLLHPKKHVDKVYYVELEKPLSSSDINELENGVYILGDYLTKPCKISQLSENTIEITISEGKFHQIKKMMHAVDNKVTKLERINFGGLELSSDLEFGEYTYITKNALEELFDYKN